MLLTCSKSRVKRIQQAESDPSLFFVDACLARAWGYASDWCRAQKSLRSTETFFAPTMSVSTCLKQLKSRLQEQDLACFAKKVVAATLASLLQGATEVWTYLLLGHHVIHSPLKGVAGSTRTQ